LEQIWKVFDFTISQKKMMIDEVFEALNLCISQVDLADDSFASIQQLCAVRRL
jgi:hypothetical protein